jgi:hypothetical protein
MRNVNWLMFHAYNDIECSALDQQAKFGQRECILSTVMEQSLRQVIRLLLLLARVQGYRCYMHEPGHAQGSHENNTFSGMTASGIFRRCVHIQLSLSNFRTVITYLTENFHKITSVQHSREDF